jgi:hypothetical protein
MHLSMITYFQKHYGRRAASLARLLGLLAVPSHTVLWTIKYVVFPARRKLLGLMIGAHLSLISFEMSLLLGRAK